MRTLKPGREKGLIKKKKRKSADVWKKMEWRNDHFGIFHPRSEGVGHVCVESFPLVKGFRIAGGGGEGKEEGEG